MGDGPYRRVLLKVSGEALMGDLAFGIDPDTVNRIAGQIKQARGFRQFLLRGLDKVSAEWALICTAHNLAKLARTA